MSSLHRALAGLVAGLLLVTGALGFSNVRNVEAQEAGVLATAQAIENAWNSQNVFDFPRYFTDAGFEAEFGFSRSDLEQLSEIIGDPPITITAENIVVSDGTATADITLDFGDFMEREQWTLILDGIWKIDNSVTIPPEIPADATVVDVQLDEYQFTFDPSAIEPGDSVAFSLENVGEQQHEFVLFKVNTDTPLEELFASEGEPEGLEFLVFADAEPGGSNVAIPPTPLDSGTYAVVCFLPSPDGTPHAFLGMISEFNVGTGGGASISPPNTGDGGLLNSHGGRVSHVVLALGSLVMVASMYSLVRATRRVA